jgi:hypothetical protein
MRLWKAMTLLAVGVSTAGVAPAWASSLPPAAKTMLQNYTVVQSPSFTARANGQTHGAVSCPPGTVVLSGGVAVGSTSPMMSVNSSYPRTNTEWDGDVNNFSGVDAHFTVSAICATTPAGYTVQLGVATVSPVGQQTHAVVACPKKTVTLGGGVFSSSGNFTVGINTSEPMKNMWHVDINNGSVSDTAFRPYVICAKKPRGWRMLTPVTVDNPPQQQTIVDSTPCPKSTVILSGGVQSRSFSLAVNAGESGPIAGGWRVAENNASTQDTTVTATAICVAASA